VLGDWMSLEYYADQQGQGANPKKLYRAEYAINPDNSKRGAGYFPPDADPAQSPRRTRVVPQGPSRPTRPASRTSAHLRSPQPGWTEQNQPGQPVPERRAAGQPGQQLAARRRSAPAAAAAPVQETQPQPVAAGSGPVAMNRPWG
jgi:hypothetical protein